MKKSKNFDKKSNPNQSKPNQSEPNQSEPNQSEPNQSKLEQAKSEQLKFPQITTSSMELFLCVAFLFFCDPGFQATLSVQAFVSDCSRKSRRVFNMPCSCSKQGGKIYTTFSVCTWGHWTVTMQANLSRVFDNLSLCVVRRLDFAEAI